MIWLKKVNVFFRFYTFYYFNHIIFWAHSLHSRGRWTYALTDFFVRNSMPKNFYLMLFFGIIRILTTVRYHRNKWNADCLFTTRAIKNGVCLHLGCSSALLLIGCKAGNRGRQPGDILFLLPPQSEHFFAIWTLFCVQKLNWASNCRPPHKTIYKNSSFFKICSKMSQILF